MMMSAPGLCKFNQGLKTPDKCSLVACAHQFKLRVVFQWSVVRIALSMVDCLFYM